MIHPDITHLFAFFFGAIAGTLFGALFAGKKAPPGKDEGGA